MKTPDHIDRIGPDPDGLDFDALRKAGIAMLQELSGERWTDYNLHDPGVTILEQLCYALTDLAYRSAFEPEDYLAGPFGQIDFTRHALHQADTILPSQVLSADDYRKIIYDSIAEIEDVWLSADDSVPAHAGLYRISLKIRESLQADLHHDEQAELEQRVKQRVIAVFNAHRNLGEDLADVVVIGTQPIYLCGDIQIHSLRDPAAIFAEIFFRCSQQVVSGFRVERYLDAYEAGATLDQLFAGPRTEHGRIVNTGAATPGAAIPIARLISLVQAVDGVAHVQRLSLCDQDGQPVQGDSVAGKVLRLRFPAAAQNSFLRLHFASGAVGHYHPPTPVQDVQLQAEKAQAVLDDARIALRKARFEFDTVRHTVQTLEQVVPAPQGVQRPLREYYSIQHQFPAIYGINHFGVPVSAPLANRVSARQLKAYLYLAEQLMANYLENLQAIPQVFSIDDAHRTYFSQVIDDQALPLIEQLYVDSSARIGELLDTIVSRIDKPQDRRSRLIDVLLAMYGEEFSQKSLRRFNYYEEGQNGAALIDNKLAFLKNIVALSRDRATAFDYTQGAWRTDHHAERRINRAGVHAKIAILLMLPAQQSDNALSARLLQAKLRLSAGDQLSAADYTRITAHLSQLARQQEQQPDTNAVAEPAQNHEEVLPLALLTQGVRLDNYLIEQYDDVVHVHFQTHERRSGVVKLGSYADVEEAERHVQQLRRFICELNIASEGFYLLEHVLLRRRADDDGGHDGDGKHNQDDPTFFGSRVSVVFSGWSARFSDPDFRSLAQETVCRNLPAHLYPEFHWLDFLAMRDFEQRHRLWLEHLQRHVGGAETARLDAASASLVTFLQRHRRGSNQLYWV